MGDSLPWPASREMPNHSFPLETCFLKGLRMVCPPQWVGTQTLMAPWARSRIVLWGKRSGAGWCQRRSLGVGEGPGVRGQTKDRTYGWGILHYNLSFLKTLKSKLSSFSPNEIKPPTGYLG